MKYRLVITKEMKVGLKKIENSSASLILKCFKEYILEGNDSSYIDRVYGLYFAKCGIRDNYWLYIIGDHRVLVEIKDSELVIVAIGVWHNISFSALD